MTIASTEEIVAELRAGRMVILVDEEDRENEGDLVLPADCVTPEAINFMISHARGLVCLTLTPQRCAQLNLQTMVSRNSSAYGTNFTVSIEAVSGVTTGISAADRARTIQVAVAADARPSDLAQPGHIFPIMAQPGGVLMRAGHTEAGCDLAMMAGHSPASVICEIMKDDGEMARLPDLIRFGKKHNLKIGTIVDLIHHRSRTESIVKRISERVLQTPWGRFRTLVYRDQPRGEVHFALIQGDIRSDHETLVRVHEPLSLLDLLAPTQSQHSWDLPRAMKILAEQTQGVAVLLNCGSGHSDHLLTQFDALAIPGEVQVVDGVPRKPNFRTYGIGAQILKDIGVGKMRLLCNPHNNISAMTAYGLEITGYESVHNTNTPI
ncbi:MAG: 3,4-dihydroxy-2-butanone-4-phosphate synthase [Ottowia sp.]|nr:3,4-dihydroxy-2-butanone-4-phosphate synthase [Ottowia sp.]